MKQLTAPHGRIPLLLCGLMLLWGCKKNDSKPPPDPYAASKALHSDVVTDWYHLQLQIIRQSSPAYSNAITFRLFAFSGLSLYESVHAIIPTSVSLHSVVYQMPPMPQTEPPKDYLWLEVANAAMASSTRHFFPTLSAAAAASIDSLETAYNTRLKPNGSADAFSRSQAFGQLVADSIFSFAKSDAYGQASAAYVPPVFPGAWEPTPPAFAAPATPYLGKVRPFLSAHATSTIPAPLYAYATDSTSDYYKMVKDIYDVSLALTPDQKNMALYWGDVGVGRGYTPGGHTISILTNLIANEHLNLRTAVMCYVKAGMAMWDGAIVCWRGKYTFNQTRPVTYIRNNIDSKWLPLISTPPHPEYPAAHAFITTAAMTAVASVIGDLHSVDDHTYDFLGFPHRTYSSLSAIANEAGMSRRYGGVHYQTSIATGSQLGKTLGMDVGNTQLGKAD